MEWLLVTQFVTGSLGYEIEINQHIVTTCMNISVACRAILKAGHKYYMRGICVHDSVQK